MTGSGRTRPVADVGRARVLPWYVGPEGPGRGRLIANVALGLSVPVLALAGALRGHVAAAGAVGIVVLAVVVGVALFTRSRWPLAALVVSLFAVVATVFVVEASPPFVVASEIAVFTVACLRPRRRAAGAALAAAMVLFAVTGTESSGPVTEPRMLIVLVWTALAFALGVAVRTQRAYVVALAERARRADETREQEARARVAEERVRIARELHDVVAHHIAVINVHAGLARRAVGRDAATVDASLGHVQEAARTVLDELGAVLQVLRSNDVLEPATEPAPGFDRLDDLLATLAAAGFTVRTRATGRPHEMDRACDLAAFRIVQESLTNASKHGVGGQAELGLTHSVENLTITVSNPVEVDPIDPVVGTRPLRGHGLIGMHERAVACGGSLTAGPDGHGMFRVVAVIPYRPTGAPGATDPTTPAEVASTGTFGRAQERGLA